MLQCGEVFPCLFLMQVKVKIIMEIVVVQFVDFLGDLFIFINEVFEFKNRTRLSELINVRFV